MADETLGEGGVVKARGVRRVAGYACSIAEYGVRFAASERNVKRWLAIGRDAQDPCPLDRPGEMARWWSRRMKQRVPENVLKAGVAAGVTVEQQLAEGMPIFRAPPVVVADVGNGPTLAPAAKAPEGAQVGLAASLERIQRAEAAAAQRYLDAVAAGTDAGDVEQLRRAWDKLLEARRRVERDVPSLLERSGEVVLRADVARVLAELHSGMVTSLRNFFRRVRPKVQGVPAEEGAVVWESEVEQLVRRLREAEFGAVAE